MALQLEKPDEPISGMEVRDNAIRFVHLIKQGNGEMTIDAIAEVPLNEGVVSFGEIQDADAFATALANLRTLVPKEFQEVVLSISPYGTYTYVFTFPKAFTPERRREALRLSVKAQLPYKESNAYADSEEIAAIRGGHEVLFIAAPHARIDIYLRALHEAGFKPIAVETHPLSAVRALTNEEKDNVIFVDTESPGFATAAIFRQGQVRFVRTLPRHIVSDEARDTEIGRISAYYEAGHGPVAWQVDSASLQLIPPLNTHERIKDRQGAWAACIGAAMRGLIPRKEDTHVSLMSVGTEEAFTAKRIIRLSRLVANAVAGVAGFFVLAFGAAAIIFTGLSTQGIERSPIPASPFSAEQEQEVLSGIAEANQLLSRAAGISGQFRSWSGFLETLTETTDSVSGITVTNFTTQGSMKRMTLAGVAQDRTAISELRTALNDAPEFGDVVLPITNLDKFEDIPFSVTFTHSASQ